MSYASMSKAQLIEELKAARKQAKIGKEAEKQLRRNEEMFRSIFDGIDEVVYVADPKTYDVLYMNRICEEAFGEWRGHKCYEVLQNFDSPCPFCSNDKIFGEYDGKSYVWEWQNKVNKRWYRCIDKAIPWPDGRKVRYEMAIDVTKIKQTEERLQEQAKAILELSTPVIKIWEGIVAAPLIGTMDADRAMRFMERFLTAIVETASPMALLDITGVPEVDTQSAQYVLDAVNAARMLGAEVILTGVSPAIAQTLVHLGIDLKGIQTRNTLAAGLRLALEAQGQLPVEASDTGGDA